MKLLHIMTDGATEVPERIVEAQSSDNEVQIVDLSQANISYESVIDAIFSCDKVVSW